MLHPSQAYLPSHHLLNSFLDHNKFQTSGIADKSGTHINKFFAIHYTIPICIHVRHDLRLKRHNIRLPELILGSGARIDPSDDADHLQWVEFAVAVDVNRVEGHCEVLHRVLLQPRSIKEISPTAALSETLPSFSRAGSEAAAPGNLFTARLCRMLALW